LKLHNPAANRARKIETRTPITHSIPDIVGIIQEAALCTPAVYAILGMIEAVDLGPNGDDEH
jgi:hypothetical protein